MASYEDIHIYQGAEFTAEVTVQKDNLDFDLSSYTYAGQIRKTVNSDTIAATFAISQSTDPDLPNVLEISLSAAQTALLTASRYVYDIEVTSDDSDANVYRILEGQVTVSKNVTR